MIIQRNEYALDHRISPNFAWKEFVCKCGKCVDQHLHEDLFPLLETLRAELGNRSITITSGYRCPKHNAYVHGAPESRHLRGEATDIQVFGTHTLDVAKAAEKVGFGGVKRYKTWVHVDVRAGARWIVI